MDKGTNSGDDGSEEENEKWEGPSAKELVWMRCSAFIATILVIVGELLSEQDMWGVVVIGGSLATLNVVLTVSTLEKLNPVDDVFAEDYMEADDWELRDGMPIRERGLDMMSIDIDGLSSQDEGHASQEYSDDEVESTGYQRRLLHYRPSYDRRRRCAHSAEESHARDVVRPQKRTRSSRKEEDGDMEQGSTERSRGVETFDRKRRLYKSRGERCDMIERRGRYCGREKRERRSRDTKHKKSKRVRIAAGPTEDIIIGEV